MKFEEVINALKEGKKVSHHSEIYFYNRKIGLIRQGTSYAVDLAPWIFEDNYWEIIEEKESQESIFETIQSEDEIRRFILEYMLFKGMTKENIIINLKLMISQLRMDF